MPPSPTDPAATALPRRRFAAALAGAAAGVMLGRRAGADGPDALFPPELTRWTKNDAPVFEGRPGQWDAIIRERGWIRRDGPAAPWQMWYTGYARRGQPMAMGRAVSPDGLRWQRDPAPVYAAHHTEDMTVLKHLNLYHCFAEGKDDIAHYLTSSDGIKWDRHGSLDVRYRGGKPLSPGPYGTPTVWREDDGTWYLLYERGDKGIWLAIWQRHLTWRHVRDEPVLVPGPEGYDSHAVAVNQVIRYQGRYYMIYHGSPRKDWKEWNTNLAVSDDRVRWTKYPGNPLVQNNESSGILVPTFGQAPGPFYLYTMHAAVRRHTFAA